ncbi:DUF1338 domain-containing protein [Prolixibacteraceae bacterium JC049]|nr:DUF1338 domain-containing protein [Prolixibacteraceae bacterium JC049]
MNLTAEQITQKLLDRLWMQYIQRVSYARTYVELVTRQGGTVHNDHIALRTLNTNTGKQPSGVEAFRPIWEALGFIEQSQYQFPKKKLNAIHFQHPNIKFPKVFVSQLEVDHLPTDIQKIINEAVNNTQSLLSKYDYALLEELKEQKMLDEAAAHSLIESLFRFFKRPWEAPLKDTVLQVNEVSQYGAWTLLHGNSINHFTAYINFQQVEAWPTITKTVEGLRNAQVPMKKNIEGEANSILQQSSTEAVTEACLVKLNNGGESTIEWTYAYYELAERGIDPTTGELFQGFLGEQATHLFDMTGKQ